MVRHNKSYEVKRILLVLCLVLNLSMVFFPQGYLVHQYDEKSGLMTPTVFDVVQDNWGRLWFTTRLGVAVYDGVSWKRYAQAEGLSPMGRSKIRIDHNGTVWVAGSSYNRLLLFYFNGQSWHKVPTEVLKDNQFVDLSALALSKQGEKTVVAAGTEEYGVYIWNGEDWSHFTTREGLPDNKVNGIASVNDKFYIISDGGLSIIKNGRIDNSPGLRLKWLNGPLRGIGIEYRERSKNLAESALTNTRIWLCGDNWLGFFSENEREWTRYSLPASFSSGKPSTLLMPDYRSGVYIGGSHRVFYFDYVANRLEILNQKNGLIDSGAYAIYVDFEGNIWIPCERGISKIASRRFGSFQQKHGLLENEVTAILEYEPGKFIFGHNKGVTFFEGQQFETIPFDYSSEFDESLFRVLDIKKDSKRNIWLAVARLGVCRIDPQHQLKWYNRKNVKGDFFNCLWIEKNDTIWVGTLKAILKFQGETLVPQEIPAGVQYGFRKIFIPSIRVKQEKPPIYVGTYENGLYVYRDTRWYNYRIPGDHRVNSIYAIIENHEGKILLGTLKGIYSLEDNTLKKYEAEKIPLDRPVYFILEDRFTNLWLGTDNGVMCWDRKRVIRYSIQEGLVGQETNRAAGIVDSRGRVWIGTSQGVSFYDERFDSFRSKTVSPRLRLLYLETLRRQIPLQDANLITLSSQENRLAFRFRAFSFVDEKAIRFRHKLEGVDSDWSNEHYPYNQVIRYKNLSPGNYRFYIKARNALGVWSPVVKSGLIVIASPFYQTWWFYMSIAVVAGLLLISVQRYFSVKRHSRLLEMRVAERTTLLKAAEEKYFKLFDESKDAVLIISPQGKFIDCNPSGLEMLGYRSKNDILKANLFEEHIADSRDGRVFRQDIEQKGYVKNYELFLRRSNSERILTLVTANAVKGVHDEFIAYRGIFRDITERRGLENQLEQARRMESIGRLAGGVAHHLNNVLSGLINYPEVLLMEIPEGDPQRQIILAIKKTGERAAALVQDLLSISQGCSGIHELVSLNDIVDGYLISPEHLSLKSAYPRITFETRLESELAFIMGSPLSLFKALMNLVANGAEAVQGRGKCLITTENVMVEEPIKGFEAVIKGAYAVLSVIDNGRGIPRENISKIFEPFYTDKNKKIDGTGLGMNVVWAVVKDHEGFIDVKSKVTKGTAFTLYFPAYRN